MWSSLVFGNRQFRYQMLLAKQGSFAERRTICNLTIGNVSILYHRLNWKMLSASYIMRKHAKPVIDGWSRQLGEGASAWLQTCILNTLRNYVYPSNATLNLPKWQYMHACKSIEPPHTLHAIDAPASSLDIRCSRVQLDRWLAAPANASPFTICRPVRCISMKDAKLVALAIRVHCYQCGRGSRSSGSMIEFQMIIPKLITVVSAWQYWHWRAS